MAEQLSMIVPDLSSYTDEELREKVKQIRRSRVMRKDMSNKTSDRPANKSKKSDNALSMLSAMPAEEREALLKLLSQQKGVSK